MISKQHSHGIHRQHLNYRYSLVSEPACHVANTAGSHKRRHPPEQEECSRAGFEAEWVSSLVYDAIGCLEIAGDKGT